MTIREYLISIDACECHNIEFGYRTEFTIFDDEVEHSVSFISNTVVGENDEYFDVYFSGRAYDNPRKNMSIVFSGMRITTVEEARFIIEHLVYKDIESLENQLTTIS